MKRSMHFQDAIPLIAGVYAFLSPLWTTHTDRSNWTLVVLGIITAVAALATLADPDRLPFEGFVAFLGAALFVSPWVMSFDATRPSAWVAWIAGGVTFLVGAGDLQYSRTHGGHMASMH